MTTPRERPILFSGPMVSAILDGKKTQTRRVMSPQPVGFGPIGGLQFPVKGKRGTYDCLGGAPLLARCSFGAVGDRLWVREPFASPSLGLVAYRADGECGAWLSDGGGGRFWNRHGGVLEVPGAEGPSWGLSKFGGRWRPSIHMPRWASRLDLEITGVRAERIQDITEEDAQAEGRTLQDFGSGGPGYFPHTWDALNGKRGFSWSVNPWVWVIVFGVVP